VAFGLPLDDVVVFDVPGAPAAECLCELLLEDRLAWVYDRDGGSYVAAEVRAEAAGDLATLLWRVEAWAGERGLGGVHFEVDGRPYTLVVRAAASPLT
jgi:hypothetical protein